MAAMYYRGKNATNTAGSIAASKSAGPRGPYFEDTVGGRPKLSTPASTAPTARAPSRDFAGIPDARYGGTHLSEDARAAVGRVAPAGAGELTGMAGRDPAGEGVRHFGVGPGDPRQGRWGPPGLDAAQGGAGDFSRGMGGGRPVPGLDAAQGGPGDFGRGDDAGHAVPALDPGQGGPGDFPRGMR